MLDEALQQPFSGAPRREIEPVPVRPQARRQFSFSRLSGTLHPRPLVADDSDPPAARSIDPRGLGTLVHAVLAALEPSNANNRDELVRRHAMRHLNEDPGQVAEALAMVERFVASPRYAALSAAAEDHAEIEFLLRWPLEDRYRSGHAD